MNLNVFICDDYSEDLANIHAHLLQYAFQYDENLKITTFSSGKDLLNNEKISQCNIIFLDIEMPGTDGLMTAQLLRQHYSPELFIVFTTSYPEYMQDSFEVQPFQFLTKPISYPKIERIMKAICHRIKNSSYSTIVVDDAGEEHFVSLRDLIYIRNEKSRKGFLSFRLTEGNILSKGSLVYYEDLLKEEGFVSPTRGFLMNVRFIKSFNGSRVLLKNGEQLEVSRRKSKELQKEYANQIIKILQ